MSSILYWGLLPPLLLLVYIYHLDKIEREPVGLIAKAFLFGVICTFVASFLEQIGDALLSYLPFREGSTIYNFLMYFIIVAGAEEFCKRTAGRLAVWKSPEFNFRFDAVIYWEAAALGFAAFENIMYMFAFGEGIALGRLIPVHAICGIYMGYYMGLAKTCELRYGPAMQKRNERLALLIPMLIHGAWDFCVSSDSAILAIGILVFIVILTIRAFLKLRDSARADMPI